MNHVGEESEFTVYASDGEFLYSDESKNEGRYSFNSQVRRYTSTLQEFAAEMERKDNGGTRNALETCLTPSNCKNCDRSVKTAGEDGSAIVEAEGNGSHGCLTKENSTYPQAMQEKLYLQNMLYEGLGPVIVADFREWKWKWVLDKQKELGFGPLSTNMLLVGQTGVVTPTHYDEQQNFFAQIHGTKRVTLFSPADFKCLYPYPVGHPADRQSQVHIESPDLSRFPDFESATPMTVDLAPGEVLYIPSYWWHHIASPFGYTISTNFWFKPGKSTAAPTLPLKDPAERMALRRNLEKLTSKTLGGGKAAREFFTALERTLGQEHGPVEKEAGTEQKGNAETNDESPRPPPPPLGAAHVSMLTQLKALVGVVLAPEEIGGFLKELVRGRFVAQQGRRCHS